MAEYKVLWCLIAPTQAGKLCVSVVKLLIVLGKVSVPRLDREELS